jgi:nitroreductase
MQELLSLIQTRHSTRMPFNAQRPVAKEDLRQILEAGRWAPTAHNMQNFEIVVVDDPKILDEIGDFPGTVSDTFIEENYRQLSFSEEELSQKKVGLLGTAFPASWRTADASAVPQEDRKRSFPACPTLLILLYDPARRAPASEGDFLGIISLGCMTENLWLEANSLGIDFHVVSSLADGPVEAEVKRILSIPQHLRIVYGVRLGYAVSRSLHPLRVRREIEEFCHHNAFDNKGID